jgi:nucleoside-diphosphate-sugar epimerase
MRVVVVDAHASSGRALLEAMAQHKFIDHVVSVGGSSRSITHSDLDIEISVPERGDDFSEAFRYADAVVYAGGHLNWFSGCDDGLPSKLEDVCRGVASAGVHAFVCGLSVGAYSPAPMDQPVSESWPTLGTPGSRLSLQLSQAERVIGTFQEESPIVRVVSLRMAPVVGPVDSTPPSLFERWGAPALGRYLLGQLINGTHGRIIPDLGTHMFQATYVADMADALCRAVTESVVGPYNIAGQPFTSRQLAESLSARTVAMSLQNFDRAFRLTRGLGLHSMDKEAIDLALHCPLVETSHARDDLGWAPHHEIGSVLKSFANRLSDERHSSRFREKERTSI